MPSSTGQSEQQPAPPMQARRLHLIVSENKDGYPELLPSFSCAAQKPKRRVHVALIALCAASCVGYHIHIAMNRYESMNTSEHFCTALYYVACAALLTVYLFLVRQRKMGCDASSAADKNDDLVAIMEYDNTNCVWSRRFETAELVYTLVLTLPTVWLCVSTICDLFSTRAADVAALKHILCNMVFLVLVLVVRSWLLYLLQGRERTLRSQRQSEANSLLNSILVYLPGTIWWTVDPKSMEFTFLQATSVAAIIDRTPNDLLGKTIYDIPSIYPWMHQHEVYHIIDSYDELMKSGRSCAFSYEHPSGSGPRSHVITPVLGGAGGCEVVSILGSSIDTSELQMAQKALRQSERYYRLIMDNIQDHVLRVAQNGRVLYSNHDFWSISGQGDSKNDGNSIFSLFERNPLVLEQVKRYMYTLFEESLPMNHSSVQPPACLKPIEFIIDSKCFCYDGVAHCLYSEADLYESSQYANRSVFDAIMADELTFYSLSMNPVLSDDGSQVDSVIMVMLNYTERRKALEQQRRNESILVASSSKAEMLRILSHELRNPLQAILGSLELLDSMPNYTKLSEMQQEFLTEAQANSRLLLDILNDFLDAEKIGTGVIDIVPSPYNLLSLLEGAVEMMSGAAARRGVELLIELDDYLPQQVMVDATRLNQIVLNLIGNACKFTREEPEPFVKLSARKLSVEENKVSLLITCEDNGIGILKSEYCKIFYPFVYVAKMKNPSEFGGFGLGLPIVHNILDKMGGRIWLESTPGVGTIFFVYLSLEMVVPDPIRSLLEPTGVSRVVMVEPKGRTAESCLLHQLEYLQLNSSKVDILDNYDSIESKLRECQSLGESAVVIVECASPVLRQLVLLQMPTHVIVLHKGNIKDIPSYTYFVSVHYLKKPVRLSKLHKALQGAKQVSRPAVTPAPGSPFAYSRNVSPYPTPLPEASLSARSEVKLRICIVDDSSVNTRVIQYLLRKEGFTEEVASIVTCSDGQEAVDLVKSSSHVFSCILMDLMMPQKDGWQASAEIRQIPGYKHVPIIALTGNQRDEQTMQKCREAGMDDILTKPVSSGALVKALNKYLKIEGITMN